MHNTVIITGFIYAGKSFLHKPTMKHLIEVTFTDAAFVEHTLTIYFNIIKVYKISEFTNMVFFMVLAW